MSYVADRDAGQGDERPGEQRRRTGHQGPDQLAGDQCQQGQHHGAVRSDARGQHRGARPITPNDSVGSDSSTPGGGGGQTGGGSEFRNDGAERVDHRPQV